MTPHADPRGPRERAYDTHLAPLIDRLSALCAEHDVPFILATELDSERDPQSGARKALCCLSTRGEFRHPTLRQMLQVLSGAHDMAVSPPGSTAAKRGA